MIKDTIKIRDFYFPYQNLFLILPFFSFDFKIENNSNNNIEEIHLNVVAVILLLFLLLLLVWKNSTRVLENFQ